MYINTRVKLEYLQKSNTSDPWNEKRGRHADKIR